MSAIPEEFLKKTAELSEDVTRPFSSSEKVYVEGSRPDIQVPMRAVQQMDTQTDAGVEKNPPIKTITIIIERFEYYTFYGFSHNLTLGYKV